MRVASWKQEASVRVVKLMENVCVCVCVCACVRACVCDIIKMAALSHVFTVKTP